MKVFLSWSGLKSKRLAEILRNWIPAVIQAAKPYFSPDDIEKGTRWYPEVSKELEKSSVGIICLTHDNLEAPWILFETGALAKTVEKSRVIPVLFGLRTTDIKGPLSQFQAAVFQKDEIKKALKTINLALGEDALELSVLESVFEKWWPELESKVLEVMKDVEDEDKKELRDDREILEEILGHTRAINSKLWDQYNSFSLSIDELELPVAVAIGLRNADIKRVGELVQFTESELLKIKNFNKKYIYAIKEVLAPLGLSLRMGSHK